ncbi:MAG: hypothetical protein MR031_05960 [Tenericutes bacterium]|nr:hypothetical protein [Mycoplasmatota bacterium]
MTEYKQYVEAVNKIFEYITVMRQDWPNPDNVSYIENIEQYKQLVIDSANLFSDKKMVTPAPSQNDISMEELGND